ncbi:myocyte enhancer factor 2A [Salpingoeca rosetta]|uniref:Myocyte enhancer factor 2A n=1 Tax=Salpingoeca rosetta (strain ATCC 50818 / BSB-021) TaxID=946362 RepID=F2UQW2_SALR5|nr:myocyte enhancer factor 2A [Salpingoeca rosetta]EGD80017.1 myocyte enhancer factor 2A [Salpingoeca rosetta]|eukprot:XP_004988342.1 myocyte enhancer factor 2A [Salpingoeca rosetta]
MHFASGLTVMTDGLGTANGLPTSQHQQQQGQYAPHPHEVAAAATVSKLQRSRHNSLRKDSLTGTSPYVSQEEIASFLKDKDRRSRLPSATQLLATLFTPIPGTNGTATASSSTPATTMTAAPPVDGVTAAGSANSSTNGNSMVAPQASVSSSTATGAHMMTGATAPPTTTTQQQKLQPLLRPPQVQQLQAEDMQHGTDTSGTDDDDDDDDDDADNDGCGGSGDDVFTSDREQAGVKVEGGDVDALEPQPKRAKQLV